MRTITSLAVLSLLPLILAAPAPVAKVERDVVTTTSTTDPANPNATPSKIRVRQLDESDGLTTSTRNNDPNPTGHSTVSGSGIHVRQLDETGGATTPTHNYDPNITGHSTASGIHARQLDETDGATTPTHSHDPNPTGHSTASRIQVRQFIEETASSKFTPTVGPAPRETDLRRQLNLLPSALDGVLDIVKGALEDVKSAVDDGNAAACSSALIKIQPTAKPTDIQQVLAQQAAIWASPTRTDFYAGVATQVANGLGPLLDGTLSTALQGGLPVGENSVSNNNKAVSGLYPKKSSTTDATYSVPEAALRAAIYFPPGFTYGKKTPVLFVPGTGAYGGANFANNLRKLLTGQSYADPVWVNVPGAMLGDAQVNAEYIAYAINYISAVSQNKKMAVISWSQGGLDTQWVLKYWPSTRKIVQDFLPVSPDFGGTILANALCLSANSQLGLVPCNPSVIQQQSTSNYIKQLRKNGGASAFVPTTTFYSGFFDEIVEPQQGNAASAFLNPGANAPVSNNEVQTVCANQPGGSFYGHAGVLFNPLTYALIVDALTHPGTTGQVSRINRQSVCASYAAPGLDLDDVLATSGLIPVAAVLLLADPQKLITEPALKPYATY